VGQISVTVDISHTYSGDLTISLSHAGRTVTLQAGQGGADDDIKKTFTVSDFAGTHRDGAWTLTVIDAVADDVGVLNRWSLDLR
jgi:serine protease